MSSPGRLALRNVTRGVLAAATAAACLIPGPARCQSPAGPVASAPAAAEIPEIPLSLHDAIGIALRNSNVIRTVEGATASVTAFDPTIGDAAVRAAEAGFDPAINATVGQGRYNQPPSSFFGPGLTQPYRRADGNVNAAIRKKGVYGTDATVGYLPPTAYFFLPNGRSGFNPLYSSNLQVSVRQPLLRGFGRDVNEAPIRVARIAANQSVWELRAATQSLVRGVEETYWNLYAARQAAAAYERTLELSREVVRIQRERLAVERAVPAEVARAQAEVFRYERLVAEAEGQAAVAEVRLRDLLGVGLGDGGWLTPVSRPETDPAPADRRAAFADALAKRPDLAGRRLEIAKQGIGLDVAENGRRPQLDAVGLYRASGVGGGWADSVRQAASFGYADYTAGLTFDVPIGNRAAKANVQAAELALSRARALLRRSEQAATLEVEARLREAAYAHARYVRADGQVRENAEWLRATGVRFADPPPEDADGTWLTTALTDLLLAMRNQADAEAAAAAALAAQGVQLARLEEAKGTILDARRIEVIDGDREAPGPARNGPARPPVVWGHTPTPKP